MSRADPFDRDARVRHGAVETVARGVRRVVAANPSPMTFTGTASYLLGARDVALIDPGPDDPAHRAALLRAIGPSARLRVILVTHSHRDHSAGAAALAQETGAEVLGFGPHGAGLSAQMQALRDSGAQLGGGEGADADFAPDRSLEDGEEIAASEWRLTALHTPGHLSNHLAFALEGEGALFTGDVVMGWSTTLISPPEGDMVAFMATLARLRGRDDRLYLPGHGPAVRDPQAMLDWQLAHRRARKGQILEALAQAPATPRALTERIYADIDPKLWAAAERNVLAHLLGLVAEGRVRADGPPGPRSAYALA